MTSCKHEKHVFISIWWGRKVLKMRKKVDKDKASPPIPNKRKEKENKASPPTPLQGEGSDMFSNCILFAFYFQGILLPSLFGEGPGERLCFFPYHLQSGSVLMLPNFHKKAKASLRQVLSLIYFPRKICKFAAINPLTNEQRME